MLKRIKFEQFTAFDQLEVEFSPGINIFVGPNGTGKTHILKAAYSACAFDPTNGGFALKLNNVFYPSNKQIGRLVKRSQVGKTGSLEVERISQPGDKLMEIKVAISTNHKFPEKATVSGALEQWAAENRKRKTVFIPVKDMMANSKGFSSLYASREINFEEIYADIVNKVLLPPLRGPMDSFRRALSEKLSEAISGTVVVENEEFFLSRKGVGKLEFTLLAEGFRKLGLLWVLIQNGVLAEGSVLFWDEPEANLNPKLMRCVVEILLELRRHGVQIFLATHDYILLKEFYLQTKESDQVSFHSLYHSEDKAGVAVASTGSFYEISPNAIDEAYGDLVTRDIQKQIGDAKK